MRLVYFAWVREAIGVAEEVVDVPGNVETVAALIDWLSAQPTHAVAFADRSKLRAAIDGVFVPISASMTGAREVAIFPPVTGG